MKNTLLLALTLIAGPAFAQQPAAVAAASPKVDARFAAWIGCWRLEDDLAGTGARMCITPETNGIRMQTVVGSNKGIDEVVIPDGASHPIADSDCKGTERADFSQDNQRVFRTTQVACGKEAPRKVQSVAFLAGSTWFNVQHVSGDKANTAVRVERYRRSTNQQLADGSKAPQATAEAIVAASATDGRWSVEDVIEASAKLPAEAVQAAIAELKLGFDLNKKTLLALNEGKVQGEVIDVMVALTYPKRFVVERRGGSTALPAGISMGGGLFDPFMAPILMGTYADCYSPIGYGYRSYYSMCGNMFYPSMYTPLFDYYTYNRYGYNGYYNGWVNVNDYSGQISSVGGTIGEAPGEGRMVSGHGYTQIRNREAEPAPRVNGGQNGGASGFFGGNSGGGTASSGGYSSGSSSGGSSGSSGGDSGARVAVPKGGGGE